LIVGIIIAAGFIATFIIGFITAQMIYRSKLRLKVGRRGYRGRRTRTREELEMKPPVVHKVVSVRTAEPPSSRHKRRSDGSGSGGRRRVHHKKKSIIPMEGRVANTARRFAVCSECRLLVHPEVSVCPNCNTKFSQPVQKRQNILYRCSRCNTPVVDTAIVCPNCSAIFER
jgi:RNA polymerase subunit RPABC4/transcription elongation factor Spt4